MHGPNEILLHSAVPLAFAVELYELRFSNQSGAIQLRKTSVTVRIRGQQRKVVRERLVQLRSAVDRSTENLAFILDTDPAWRVLSAQLG